MSVYYRIVGDTIIVLGQTFKHKEALKQIGGKYNSSTKVWSLPNSGKNLQNIEQFCAKVGGRSLVSFTAAHGLDNDSTEPFGFESEGADDLTRSTEKAPISEEMAEPAKEGFKISELMQKVQVAVASTFPNPIWIYGEIQNFSERSFGLFFDLAEPKEGDSISATVSVKAKLWKNNYKNLLAREGQKNLDEIFADGVKVRLLCGVELYKDRGYVSLNVIDADSEYSRGTLALAREALLRELRSKGLLEKNKLLVLSRFPFRVGLVSAEASRAKSDFLDQLKSYGFPGEILFFNSHMQGRQTLADVAHGIEVLSAADCDLIVITRGGGSTADLRWFDASEIAYAIANAPVPVISAIGHHDDLSIAEEVSFRREKTPTAAADFIICVFSETKNRINEIASDLADSLGDCIEDFTLMQRNLENQISSAAIQRIMQLKAVLMSLGFAVQKNFSDTRYEKSQQIVKLRSDLFRISQDVLSKAINHLMNLRQSLVSKDPTPWLVAGWTQLFGRTGLIKSINDVNIGDQVAARLNDGKLYLDVNAKEGKK